MGRVASISGTETTGHRWPVCESNTAASLGTARLIPGSRRAIAGASHAVTGANAEGRSAADPRRSLVQHFAQVVPAVFHQIAPSQLGSLLADLVVLCATGALLAPVLGPRVVAAYACLMFAIAAQEGLYKTGKSASDQFRLGKASAWASLVTVMLLERGARGMAAVALLGVTSFCLLSAWRWGWRRAKVHDPAAVANVLVVGSPAVMARVAAAVRSDSPLRRVKGLVPDWQLREMRDGNLLGRIARQEHIDEVIVAGGDRDFVASVAAECFRNRLDVAIAPEIPNGGSRVESVGGIPLVRIRAQNAPDWGLAVKRIADVLLGGIATILALPLMCAIAVAIKLGSRGPVLYRSLRVGRKGVLFTCYKFRTMRPDADCSKPELRSQNERQGAFFKMSGDPRITTVGRWLRRYSLDELPQLGNVLLGEMSLVGPRPHPVDDVELYALEDLQRLDFTPGMTGLWQVLARNDPSFKRCVALDVEYINRWSLLLDLQILGKTVSAVLRGSGA